MKSTFNYSIASMLFLLLIACESSIDYEPDLSEYKINADCILHTGDDSIFLYLNKNQLINETQNDYIKSIITNAKAFITINDVTKELKYSPFYRYSCSMDNIDLKSAKISISVECPDYGSLTASTVAANETPGDFDFQFNSSFSNLPYSYNITINTEDESDSKKFLAYDVYFPLMDNGIKKLTRLATIPVLKQKGEHIISTYYNYTFDEFFSIFYRPVVNENATVKAYTITEDYYNFLKTANYNISSGSNYNIATPVFSNMNGGTGILGVGIR